MSISLNLLLDSTTEGIWSVGLDGLISYVNRAAVAMFGYESAAEMVGRNSHELVHHTRADGTHYPQVECPIFRAFKEGRPVHLVDEVLWRKDGTSFYAEYRSVPMFENGAVIGAVTTFIDNTEIRRIQNEATLNRNWLVATLRGIGDAVITTDASSPARVTFLNPVAETLTGWTVAEAQGRPVLEVFRIVNEHTGAPAVNPVERVLREGRVVGLANHTVLISKDGARYIIEDSAAPIRRTDGHMEGVVLVFRDNTEQSRARIREQKFAAEMTDVLESMSDAFFSIDKDWNVTSVNRAHERATCKKREDQLGRNFIDLFFSNESTHGKYLPAYQKAMNERVEVQFEDFYEPLSLWTSVRVFPKSDGGLAVFFQNVTEQKRAALDLFRSMEKLKESEDRLSLALESGQMGTWHLDLNTGASTVSPQVKGILGLEADAVDVFEAIERAVHPEDQTAVRQAIRTSLETGDLYQHEYRILTPDGKIRWLLARGRVSNDPETGARGFAGILTDISERKRAEEEKNELLAIINNSNDFVALADPGTRGVFINECGRRMLGLDCADDITRLTMLDIAAAEDREQMRDIIIPALQVSGRWSGETHYRNVKTGKSLPVYVNAFTLYDPVSRKISGFAGITRDISAEIARREELTSAKAEADRANQLKSAFLANMSHEIRTPLGAIMGFSEFLKDPNLPPQERENFVDTIIRSGKSLTRIIDDILDLAKVEAGKLDFERTGFSLVNLMRDVVELFRESARRKSIGLTLHVEEGMPDDVSSDPTRLRQILTNIVGNAIKFTATGSVRVEASARELAPSTSGVSSEFRSVCEFTVRVIDTGLGLSDEQKVRLFEPFTQADNSTARKFGGTGLGLVLSRRLARALGGDVVIDERHVGEGSTFVVTFQAPTAGGPVSAVKRADTGAAPRLTGVHVLLVEDSTDNQFLVTRFLTLSGASVEIANNGEEAINKVKNGHFDVVLMDIQMPHVDGYEATRTLRKLGFELPIIALTAHAMTEERQKTLAVGCNDHLTKPLDAKELIETVARFARVGKG